MTGYAIFFRVEFYSNASYIGAEAILTIAVLCIPAVRIALNRIKVEALEKGVAKGESISVAR